MSFMYHAVPKEMIGNELIPLNSMKDTMSQIRALNLMKYKGREEILKRRIPLLNCLWNDVLHFLPIHPQNVFELQKELGLISEVPPYRFFEINIETIDFNKTVVFFKTALGDKNTEVKWLQGVDLNSFKEIPKETLEYYKTFIGTGELPLNYQFIPHIFYQGALDVSKTPIITLKNKK